MWLATFQRAQVTDQAPLILYSAKKFRTVPHVLSGLLCAWECLERRLLLLIIISFAAGGDSSSSSSSSSSSTHKRQISINFFPSYFPIFSVRAVRGKVCFRLRSYHVLCWYQFQFRTLFVPTFLVLSPRLTPLVVRSLLSHLNILCVCVQLLSGSGCTSNTRISNKMCLKHTGCSLSQTYGIYCVTFEVCVSFAYYCTLSGELPEPE